MSRRLSPAREAVLEEYLGALRRRNLARATVRLYSRGVRGFLAWLPEGRELDGVSRDDVRLYLAGRPRPSARHDLSALRVLFASRGHDDDALPTNGIHMGRPTPQPQVALSPDAVAALMAVASDVEWRAPWGKSPGFALRDRALLELLYGAGLRCSEVAATRLADLELVQGSLLARRAKRGQSAVVPLPPTSLPHLRRYVTDGRPLLRQDGDDDEGALLLSLRGRPLTTAGVYKVVVGLARRAGVRAHPHAFRRGVATSLVRQGASVLAVKELLGHVDLATTAAYVAMDVEDLRRAVAHLER